MKNVNSIKYLLILLPAFVWVFVACNKDFLDTQPLEEVEMEEVWKDPNLANAFVLEIYNGLGNGGFDEQMLASLTDEAVFTHTGRSINTVNEGSLSPTNPGWTHASYEWNSMYNRIRPCNLTIERIGGTDFTTTLKERLKGEAHFMRAYFYHQLIRYYGGVPIITKTYALNEDYNVDRNSWEDCVNFILKDCDTALTLLTGKAKEKGRADELAVLALRSRLLLYAASDLHDIPTAKAKSAVIAGFSKPELLGYVSGDRTARWQAAKAAAKAVLDQGGGGYKLDLAAPVPEDEGRTNYISMAMGGYSNAGGLDKTASKELLFARYFNPNKNEDGQRQGQFNGPNGYHDWAGNTPIGLLVDDYEMKDGTPFSWSNADHKKEPYKNRDPRFYASILYDGADWKPRDIVSGNVDPANQIQTGQYDLIMNGALTSFKGLDTRSSTIEDWNGSRTGYYVRKFIDPDPAIVDNTTRQQIPWPFFRYTEAVFNYAEACLALGEEGEAKTWLNRIRFRAGMPALTESGQALVDRYRTERRIEMAFEEQRYHDARRWMIPAQTLGRKITFINVVGKFKPGKQLVGTYRHDETIYDYTYTPVVDQAHENRTWNDKMYFRPIHRDEVNKNLKLVQNPGY